MSARWLRMTLVAAALLQSACGNSRSKLFGDSNAGASLRAEIAAYPNGEKAQIHQLWSRYVESKNGMFDCGPSDYWIGSEQGIAMTPHGIPVLRCYDLAGEFVSPEQRYEVLRIEPITPASRNEYRITSLFRMSDSSQIERRTHSALVTTFAVREGKEWKLAGAMPRLTRSWHRETVGPFNYIVQPGHKFSRARALQAIEFADSVSRAFGVPRISEMDYYIVSDGDEMLRIFGYEPDTTYGTPSGRSMMGAIVSGDPVFAENHGHEIVHQLIMPLVGSHLSIAASEGVPSWLGGSRSLRFPEGQRALRSFLSKHPEATLDTVLASNTHPMHNPAAALLARMVHDHGGVEAITRFLDSGPSLPEFKAGVARILGRSWKQVAEDWRQQVMN